MNTLTILFSRSLARAWYAWRWELAVVLLLITIAAFASSKDTNAQAGAAYKVIWASVSASTAMQAGSYQMNTTVGQPEVGVQRGGSYDLGGGFWGSTTDMIITPLEEEGLLYMPIILR